jgi:hypothetical protein
MRSSTFFTFFLLALLSVLSFTVAEPLPAASLAARGPPGIAAIRDIDRPDDEKDNLTCRRGWGLCPHYPSWCCPYGYRCYQDITTYIWCCPPGQICYLKQNEKPVSSINCYRTIWCLNHLVSPSRAVHLASCTWSAPTIRTVGRIPGTFSLKFSAYFFSSGRCSVK